eukprot:gene7128-biopygen4643
MSRGIWGADAARDAKERSTDAGGERSPKTSKTRRFVCYPSGPLEQQSLRFEGGTFREGMTSNVELDGIFSKYLPRGSVLPAPLCQSCTIARHE